MRFLRTTAALLMLLTVSAALATAYDGVRVYNLKTRVTESNSTWEKHAWQVSIRSVDPEPLSCTLTIEWLDRDGFIVDDDREYVQLKCCGATHEFSGYALVSHPAAQSIQNASAKLSCS